MKKEDVLNAVKEYKIIAILRGIDYGKIPDVVKALYDGGIHNIEVTFNQKSATKLQDTKTAISYINQVYGDKILVGAGTVMSVEEVHTAFDAGAGFILAPNVSRSVIEEAVRLNIAAIPGAMTPSEIADSYHMGATIVKLFPTGNLGLPYCKAIMAPINNIPMIAVGGVDYTNLKDYLNIGFIGAGIGSCLTNKTLINENRFDDLRNLALKFTQAAHN